MVSVSFTASDVIKVLCVKTMFCCTCYRFTLCRDLHISGWGTNWMCIKSLCVAFKDLCHSYYYNHSNYYLHMGNRQAGKVQSTAMMRDETDIHETEHDEGVGVRQGWDAGLAPHTATHLASFISICWRISCRSWSLRTGKMLRSSSSCLLGLFRSFTASSSFFILRGRVPVVVEHKLTWVAAQWLSSCCT